MLGLQTLRRQADGIHRAAKNHAGEWYQVAWAEPRFDANDSLAYQGKSQQSANRNRRQRVAIKAPPVFAET